MVSVLTLSPQNHNVMNLNNFLIPIFLLVVFVSFSQNKVCESPENEFSEMNTIGKCAIEDFKKSHKKEFVKVSTRNRFVRKRTRSIADLKKNLASNSEAKKSAKVVNRANINRIAKKATLVSNASVKKKEVIRSSEESLVKDFVKFNEVMRSFSRESKTKKSKLCFCFIGDFGRDFIQESDYFGCSRQDNQVRCVRKS